MTSFLYNALPSSAQTLWDKLHNSELGSRMARGAFWAIGGSVISRGLMLLASIVLARLLGREIYGQLGMVRSTMNTFLTFAGFGLGMTATKFVAQHRVSDPDRAGRIISISGLFAFGTGLVVASGLFVFAPWLAAHTINAPMLAGELRVGAVVLMISALNGAQTGALAGFEAFQSIAKVNLIVGVISFPVLVCGAYWGGLRGSIIALAVNALLFWILFHLALRNEASKHRINFFTRNCLAEWPVIIKFSLPVTISGLLVSPVLWGCNAILVNQPNGYAQMGLYDAANQWQQVLLFIPGAVSQIVLPLLSSVTGHKDHAGFRKVLKYNVLLNLGVTCLLALPIAILAPYIMSAYGAKFTEGAIALSILSASTVLISLNNVIGQAIASKDQMWVGLTFNVIWALSVLSLSWTFVHSGLGVTGLALANLGAYFIHSILQLAYLQQVLKKDAMSAAAEV